MAPSDHINHDPPCQPLACDIQNCLTKNNYKEEKCQNAIKALYQCCDAFYAKKGTEASSVSCPLPDLLQLKLKQYNIKSQQLH